MKHLLLLFLCAINYINAQNLVKNPSFENAKKGPWTYGEFHNNVQNWSSANFGTPDYFSINTRAKIVSEKNYRGNQLPKTGNCYAGIYMYTTKNGYSYREYIQGKIDQKLKKGATYNIRFSISLSETSSHRLDTMHAIFVSEQIGVAKNKPVLFSNAPKVRKIRDGVLELDALKIEAYNTVKIPLSFSKQLMYNWITVNFTYIASGFETHFILGNLNKNENTNIKQQNPIEKRALAYYYIDDIKLIEDKTIPVEIEEVEPITFQPEKTYTFKNVLFDFDKAILLEVSIEELDKLSLHLKENPNLNIEIYGHTDNVGLETRNKELSLQRTKAVSGYLIYKGLDTSKIKWFGFGAEQPVVENSSEENRATNRRVDFKLIKN